MVAKTSLSSPAYTSRSNRRLTNPFEGLLVETFERQKDVLAHVVHEYERYSARVNTKIDDMVQAYHAHYTEQMEKQTIQKQR